jgi:5'-nucleotidase
MSDKITLLIDQDGVIAKWYPEFLKRWKAKYPDKPFVDVGQLKSFYIEDGYPEEDHDKIQYIIRNGDFYESMDPMDGALEALKDMQLNCQDFIDPYICTAPELDFTALDCHSQKARWVRNHLGEWWLKRMVLTKDKTLVRGHILIDDKPTITGAMKPTWEHMVFTSSYSGMPEGHTFSWKDWPTLRDTIRAHQQEQAEKSAIIQPDKSIILLG